MNKAETLKTPCRRCFQKNRIVSEDTKLKMKKIMVGKNTIEIIQLNLNGEFIKIWNSMSEAEIKLKISGVGRVCNGRRKTCGGFKWKFKNE
jgi:hypothetical protein